MCLMCLIQTHGKPPIHGNFEGEYDDELWDFEGGSQYF